MTYNPMIGKFLGFIGLVLVMSGLIIPKLTKKVKRFIRISGFLITITAIFAYIWPIFAMGIIFVKDPSECPPGYNIADYRNLPPNANTLLWGPPSAQQCSVVKNVADGEGIFHEQSCCTVLALPLALLYLVTPSHKH